MILQSNRNFELYMYIGLLLIDSVRGCEGKCPKSTESIILSVILCIAGITAIICPLLCLFGPFKRLAIRWRKYLHDNLGWDYQERGSSGQRHCEVEYGVTTGNDEPPEYVNVAFIDLPPSYDEVIKNSQIYKYGPAGSSVPEHHLQQVVSQEHPQPETCYQISSGRLEYDQEPSSIIAPNASIQEPREQTNNIPQLSSITVQNACITYVQESS